jgi:hypothetical protein
MFYAPSRLTTFADARWPDIDLQQGAWEVVGKGDQVNIFALAPPLLRQLRLYRRWQIFEAEQNPAIRNALSDPETAYVPLSRNGNWTTRRASPRSSSGTRSGRASAYEEATVAGTLLAGNVASLTSCYAARLGNHRTQ